MKKIFSAPSRFCFAAVTAVTLIITGFLAAATYYINFWPTDSENPYLPAAVRLPYLPYISYIHYLPETQMFKLTMHAKEALIAGIAFMQHILKDTQSLYPNVLLLIIAHGISCLLVFAVTRKYLGRAMGLTAFVLFAFSLWPYMYILQGAHPPLVLMNFLLAVFVLQNAASALGLYFLSGIFLGLMFFSSPTSPVYLPYYLGAFIYHQYSQTERTKNMRAVMLRCCSIGAGTLFMVFVFTAPHPVFQWKQYLNFLKFSQEGNNFVIYQEYLSRFFALPLSMRGGGWAWIINYAFFIMPVMFWVYLAGLAYLAVKSFKARSGILVILLSLSTPFLVEASQVAQFGRNYFSWMVGIIFLICFFLSQTEKTLTERRKKTFWVIVAAVLSVHCAINTHAFLSDILPSRLVTTKIHRWLITHKTNEISTYTDHPRQKNMIEFFNNPKIKNKIYFWPMQTIREVKKGYILIPTLTGKTIWCECREDDFGRDNDFNELFRSGEFDKYVVARFKTLSSSKYWTQEEEICTYRDLIIGDIKDADRQKGLAWILDAEKLQRDWFNKNTPKKP